MTINENTINVNNSSMLKALNSIKTTKVKKDLLKVKVKSDQDGTEISSINITPSFTITTYDNCSTSVVPVEFVGNYYELLEAIKDLEDINEIGTLIVNEDKAELTTDYLTHSIYIDPNEDGITPVKPDNIKKRAVLELGGVKEVKEFIKNLTTILKFSASSDVSIPVITCTNLKVQDGKMTLAGIDGYKIMTSQYETQGDNLEVNLDNTFINNLISLLKNNAKEVDSIEFMVNDNNVVFVQINDIILAGNSKEGNFFAYQDLMEPARKQENVLVLKTKSLKKTLTSLGKKHPRNQMEPSIFEISENRTIIHDSDDNIKATFHIYHDYDLRIGFDSYLLMDCLNNIDDVLTTMYFGDKMDPVFIKDKNNEYLVLPYRLND